MKITATPIEQSQIVLDIEVEQERVDRALEQAYRRTVSRINVPGFRKGKAPRALVERMVGHESLLDDAVEHLVPEVCHDALNEQQMTPVARPRVEVVSTTPLRVKATVPVQPEVRLGEYRAIQVSRPEVNVSDEDVTAVLNRMREAHGEWVPVERAVQANDLVGIDLVVTSGDESLINAKDAEYVVDPERPGPLPGFTERLIGSEAGTELTLSQDVPEDFDSVRAAGKHVDGQVHLHWVKEKQLPDLDDVFATTVGEHETLDDLKQAIRTDLTNHETEEARLRHQNEVVQAVVDQANLDIPPQLAEERGQEILNELARSLDRQGLNVEQYLRFTNQSEDEFRSDLLTRGERAARRSLVLEAVAQAERIEIAESDVRAEIEQAAGDAANAQRLTDEAMQRPETRNRVESLLRERRAASVLVEIAAGSDGQESSGDAAEPVATRGEATT